MTVGELFARCKGSRYLVLSNDHQRRCPRDFWQKYRMTPIWTSEVDEFYLDTIQHPVTPNDYTTVIRIFLKEKLDYSWEEAKR